MKWLRKNKDAIVVSAIFLLAAQVSPFVVELFNDFAGSIDRFSIVDSLIKSAAHFSTYSIFTFFIVSFVGLLVGFGVWMIVFICTKWKEQRRKSIEVSNYVKSLDETGFYNEDKDINELYKDTLKIKKEIEDNEREIKLLSERLDKITKPWIPIVLSVLLALSILLETFLITTSILLPAIFNDAFNNSIEIITPYTSEETINSLKSKWRLMNNTDDYGEIYSKIDEILNNNDIN